MSDIQSWHLVLALSGTVTLLLLLWAYVIIALSTLRETIRRLGSNANAQGEMTQNLMEAWNRCVSICENCQKVMWASEVAKSKTIGNKVFHYCHECKNKI